MKKIILILFALFTCWQINAQVSSYSFSQSTGTYTEITGGTVLGVATNDDISFNAQTIGFSFVYNGVTYTQFSVNSNGFIALGATALNSYTALSSGTSNNIISALNGDLNGDATGELSYQLSGTAPNQVLTIQWKNYRHYNATGDVNNFQIKLYETTNVVEVVYGAFTQNGTNRTREVGLRDASSADFNNRTTTTDWSATTAGATNAASCSLTTAVVPTSGLTFTWSPPSCAAPGGFAVSSLTSTSATISWNAAVPVPGTGYEYYYSDVNTAPSGAGTATTNLTENLTGLSVNTPYYVWLRSDCGGGTFSAWAGPFTFRTACEAITVFPHTEDFEADNPCWTNLQVSGADNWVRDAAGGSGDISAAHGGTGFMEKNYNSSEALLFSPAFDFTALGTDGRVRVWLHRHGSADVNDEYTVYVNTSKSLTGATQLLNLYSLTTVSPTVSSTGWYEYVMNIPSSFNSSNNVYIIFQGLTSAGFSSYDLGVDDFVLELKPSCVEPNTIIASNITSTTVDLSWTDGSGGLQFDYQYAIQAPGTGIPTGAGAPINDVTVLAEGFDINGNPLTANTLYEVYVRADCSGGSFSTWSGPITFRTLCNAVGTINQNFDGVTTPALPDCWSKILRGATLSTFATVTTTGTTTNSAPNSAALYNSSSATTTTDDIILVSPVLSNLSAGTHRLKFYAKTTGSIQVGTLNNNTASAVFTPFQTIATTATSTLYVVDFSTYAGTDTFIGFRHNSGTFVTLYVDDVVWEPIPATAPSCASNIVATPNASCGNFANSITWDATPNADGYYITVGTTSGGTDVANASSITTNTYSFSGNIGTTYFYTIVPFNAIGSATGCTEQSFTTNASGCYCVSAPTSVDGTGITNVQLVATNFANTVSTSPVYNDHTATVVDMSQGISNSVQITFNTDSFGTSYDYNTVIWIDVNDNFTFEPSEIVFTGVSAAVSPTILNASFVMPGTAPLGQHRMRIVATDALQTPANPCYSGSYGETADFTVNVVAATCTPPAATTSIVPACGTTQFSIDVNVTALGSGTPSISDGTTTWPISAIGVVNVGPFASGSSVTLTLLHGSDVTCNLPLGSLTYSCPPVNDDCGNAISILAMPYNNTQDASTATGPVVSTCTGMNDGVWYTVVGNGGDIIIDVTAVTGWDPELGVYTGSCGTFTCVASIDNGGTSAGETYTIVSSTLGTTYYINVGHYSSFGDSPEGPFTIGVTTTLSSGSFDNANFSAYPNPVKDVLNVSYTSEISSVRVINMIGQEVISKNINATSSQIDMSQLSAGTYIVNVTVGDTIKTLKVVKQ